MKVAEMFTGIGSQYKALKKVGADFNQDIDIVATCEWDIHAIIAYDLIHNNPNLKVDISEEKRQELLAYLSVVSLSLNGKEPIKKKYLKSLNSQVLQMIMDSIKRNNNLIDVTKVKGNDIPNDTELLTYSFPCQDLSNVGRLHGYSAGIDRDANSRSGLLWEIERILEEKKEKNQDIPKFLLLENVTTLEAKRHADNFQDWKNKLVDLGYVNKVYKLNSLDFGIPQHRNRLLMLSVFVGDDLLLKSKIEQFFKDNDLNDKDHVKSLNICQPKLENFLKMDYSKSYLLEEALECQPNNTQSRKKIWKNNNVIVDKNNNINTHVQTITTKQDRHPNSGNLYFNPKNDKAEFRFLTPRECFLLMGFEENDYEALVKNNEVKRAKSLVFSRDILYKLAGNSIVVNVLEQVFRQVFQLKEIIE